MTINSMFAVSWPYLMMLGFVIAGVFTFLRLPDNHNQHRSE